MAEYVPVDPKIWRVIAGPCSEFPTLNSRVYYYPQGHIEEASAPLPKDLSHLITPPNSSILCDIVALSYLANPDTDEVVANLSLEPTSRTNSFNPLPAVPENNHGILSYVKVLQSSELDLEGGVGSTWNVPVALSKLFFPPINPRAGIFQGHKVTFTDLMWKEWNFVYCYNSNPKVAEMHVIIQGWGEFVTKKKLRAGDTIVFVKKDSLPGKNFFGIRRLNKTKVHPDTVVFAIESAMKASRFTVLYTPSPGIGWCDFVVRSHIVDETMRLKWWLYQQRVKMAVETVFSGVHWIHGRITAISNSTNPNSPISSPFRAFQIRWDHPGETLLQLVSPWQLKPIYRVHVPYSKWLSLSMSPSI